MYYARLGIKSQEIFNANLTGWDLFGVIVYRAGLVAEFLENTGEWGLEMGLG